jgi:hypothetical protein
MRHLIRFACMLCVSLVLAALASMPAAGAAQQPAPQETVPQAEPPAGIPVTLDGKTLFYVRQRMFTLSAEERAKAIADRIRWLSKQPANRIQEVHTEEAEITTAIVSGDVVIATVTDKDAAATGFSRNELAQGYAEVIRKAAEARRNEYSARSILIGAVYAALATVLDESISTRGTKPGAEAVKWESSRTRRTRFSP